MDFRLEMIKICTIHLMILDWYVSLLGLADILGGLAHADAATYCKESTALAVVITVTGV